MFWGGWSMFAVLSNRLEPMLSGDRGRILDKWKLFCGLNAAAVRQQSAHVVARAGAGEFAEVPVEVRLVVVAANLSDLGEAGAVVAPQPLHRVLEAQHARVGLGREA